jgi:hypothetical protein
MHGDIMLHEHRCTIDGTFGAAHLRGGCTDTEYNSNRRRLSKSKRICGHDSYTYSVAGEATTAVWVILTTL